MQQQITNSKALNSQWVKYRAVAYFRGKGVSWGAGPDSPVPRESKAPGVFCINAGPQKHPLIDICSDNLDFIKNESLDYLFIGMNHQRQRIDDLIAKVKPYGHLIVHTKSEETIVPKGGWLLKDTYERNEQKLTIYKRDPRANKIYGATQSSRKRACVCRYGAVGDMVMVTPLLARLKAEGYHVTVNTTPYSAPILENNPNVDNIIIQERDGIPNSELGHYWDEWRGDYDKYINLSESLEGSLLRIPTRLNYYLPQSERTVQCGTNYLEHTFRLSGYDYRPSVDPLGEIYLSANEHSWANEFRKRLEKQGFKFIILWGINGSAAHKIYVPMEQVLTEWFSTHPDACVVSIGDANARANEFDHKQLIRMANKTSLRQLLSLVSIANCVIGPESALVNIATCFNTDKIVLLSHSTCNNLTRDWPDTITLTPEDCPCYPCHQLHYTRESCPLVEAVEEETGKIIGSTPRCTIAIPPPKVHAALTSVYLKHQQK